uniref:Acylglycerol kinase, mitochondrial n=1 Tax=Cyclopterus lumpus TaxID=8103 RepID=A0A8C3AU54_CYCLU
MARVVKVFRTLRNNWKKSTFAVCVLSYGGYWLYGKHSDNVLRREACLAAREFGRQQIAPQERLRKATVILNPAACSGKANKLFEKNAAPLLHLAGVEITIVKTDYEGQAKKLMELMEQTDMLIVAGGDGTLQEVITGLLRRADQVGVTQLLDITSATLSILKGETVPLDVLQIKGEKEQPVFALTGLRWGAFRDVAATISKYWYLGPLKTNAAHWFSTLREWPLVREISVSYLAPSLRPADLHPQKPPRPNLLSRIIRRLQNRWSPPIEEPPKVEEPEQWKEEHLSTLELFIQTQNKNPMERVSTKLFNFQEDPSAFTKDSTKLEASACQLQLPEGASGFYNIDNEEYEAMPVEVRLLPRKLRFFISAEQQRGEN